MSAPAMPDDARARLPREPYPGLRPFLDFEAALLFGRERQVREVIERLRQTQFVAVLGGSGSGKSSLIHAGVVPELRSFGIPGAGDLWLPMTCTPGTNVSAEDSAARRSSPITRLARRFAGLLRSRGAEQADAARLADIAEVFRQEAGFARLLDTYGAELAVPSGPDPAEARVLFVLDQFEEIFHPTNKGVADAALLVERVLDHFFNPHARCHVILTMRSEHLNDCAAFLELPDAINKSSYLIRRLDDGELRDAIVGPAQRFLRLMARSDRSGQALPAEVVFDEAVLQRLLRDVKSITHDPDHLPLLQHLLARLWEAALAREEMDVPVPARVSEIDLVRAVGGGALAPGDEQPLDERTNTLRECVENWPEAVYRGHAAPERAQLDALFRQLAFKDPNTGLYSQQRIEVESGARLLGAGMTSTALRALVAEGFLGSVDYLFWDKEDPARVTLKVSHESFIRGWSRFRELIDVESERFDEFVGVLRKCAAWDASRRHEDFLLETGEIRRLRESDFESRLARPEQRAAWFRYLQLDRDGVRLAGMAPQLDTFLATSNQRQRERERREGRWRRNWLLLGALTLTLLPSAMFSVFIQAPVTHRAELLFDAGNRANRAPLTPDYPGVGAAAAPLASLLRAAELIDDARTGQGSLMARVSEWLLESLAWIPPVRRQDAFLRGVAAQAEPPVNGKLRQLLSTALWQGAPRRDGDVAIARPAEFEATCAPAPSEAGQADTAMGQLFVAGAGPAQRARRRAIFVPRLPPGSSAAIVLRGATYDAASAHCEFGQVVVSIPRYLDPSVILDSGLRYFAYTAQGPNVEIPSVTVQEIDWERVEDTSRIVQSQTRAVVTDAAAVGQVRQAAGASRVAVAESWPQPGGRALGVGTQAWRLVSHSAQRLPVAADDVRFAPLRRSPPDSVCARMTTGWAVQPGFRSEMFEDGTRCFAIARGRPAAELAPGQAAGTREQVLVAVYERPAHDELVRLAENPPAPIASLAEFARVQPGDATWLAGTSGAYAGWLALRGESARGAPRLVGAPWSTCALWRLGRELEVQRPGARGATATSVTAAAGTREAAQGICVDR
jgi:hypothetical protein